MQIERKAFIQGLSKSILCPKDLGIEVNKEGKTCGFSTDCQRCWNEALVDVSNFELIGGIEECQK